MLRRIGLAIALTVLGGPALAGPSDGMPPRGNASMADDAIERGSFHEAEEIGEKAGDVAGLTSAADAFLLEGRFILAGRPKVTALQKAETLSRKALAMDPWDRDARIAYAVALGSMAREQDNVTLYFKGVAFQGRREIERILTVSPGDPRGLALMGEWNIEVVRRAGPKLAQSLYHASLDDGIRFFEAGVAGAPDNAVIHAEFGLALLGLKDPALRPRARQELETALAHNPASILEKLTLARAREALNHLS